MMQGRLQKSVNWVIKESLLHCPTQIIIVHIREPRQMELIKLKTTNSSHVNPIRFSKLFYFVLISVILSRKKQQTSSWCVEGRAYLASTSYQPFLQLLPSNLSSVRDADMRTVGRASGLYICPNRRVFQFVFSFEKACNRSHGSRNGTRCAEISQEKNLSKIRASCRNFRADTKYTWKYTRNRADTDEEQLYV